MQSILNMYLQNMHVDEYVYVKCRVYKSSHFRNQSASFF